MTRDDEPDPGPRKIDCDDPQRLLILAYTRLFLLPERANGSKLTCIASFGNYDVRLRFPRCGSNCTTVLTAARSTASAAMTFRTQGWPPRPLSPKPYGATP